MCGRARCTLSPDAVTRATGARPDWRDQHLCVLRASYLHRLVFKQHAPLPLIFPESRSSTRKQAHRAACLPPYSLLVPSTTGRRRSRRFVLASRVHVRTSAPARVCAARPFRFRPSFNVAPGTFLPVVRAAASTAPSASPHAASASAKLAPAEAEGAAESCAEVEEADEEGRAQEEVVGERGEAGEADQEEQAEGERKVQAEGEWQKQAEGKRGEQAGEEREVQVMKWGLVPSFCSKTQPPDHFRMV
ncbi:unnamed protein product [Closterium sp. NIES-53]